MLEDSSIVFNAFTCISARFLPRLSLPLFLLFFCDEDPRCEEEEDEESTTIPTTRFPALMTRSAYGTSSTDGSWTENASNPFNDLISLARGKRDIVQAGESCLYERSMEVPLEDIESTEIQDLVSEMLAIVKGRGVGLAAPQIGVKKRVFVMEDTKEGMSDESEEERKSKKRVPFKAKAVINPVITPIGDRARHSWKGVCRCKDTEHS